MIRVTGTRKIPCDYRSAFAAAVIGEVREGEGRRDGYFKRHQWTRDDWSEMNGRDGEIGFAVIALQPLRKGLSHVPGSMSLPP